MSNIKIELELSKEEAVRVVELMLDAVIYLKSEEIRAISPKYKSKKGADYRLLSSFTKKLSQTIKKQLK